MVAGRSTSTTVGDTLARENSKTRETQEQERADGGEKLWIPGKSDNHDAAGLEGSKSVAFMSASNSSWEDGAVADNYDVTNEDLKQYMLTRMVYNPEKEKILLAEEMNSIVAELPQVYAVEYAFKEWQVAEAFSLIHDAREKGKERGFYQREWLKQRDFLLIRNQI